MNGIKATMTGSEMRRKGKVKGYFFCVSVISGRRDISGE